MMLLFDMFVSLIPIAVIFGIIYAVILISDKKKKEKYEQSTYFRSTNIPYHELLRDKGRIGEKIIYDRLSSYEQTGARFLFNTYLKRENVKTSEVDVIMIHTSGIYVFESKQYSGWIFGSADQKFWTQTLNRKTKNRFYNPILQNRTHIKYLISALSGLVPADVCRSVIVFSDNCQLRTTIPYADSEVVIQQRFLQNYIMKMTYKTPGLLSQNQVDDIYNMLFPLTQVSNEVKIQHINDIKANNN